MSASHHHVHVPSLRNAVASIRRGGTWLIAGGIFSGLFAMCWMLLGVGMIIEPVDSGSANTGVLCGIFGALVPGVAAGIGIAVGIRRRRRAARLARLSWLAETQPALDPAAVAATLGIDGAAMDALLIDAWSLGVLQRGAAPAVADTLPAPVAALGTPPPAPSPSPRRGSPRATTRGSLVGESLNDTWRIVRHLGDGACGSVYEASHTRIPKRVAVKVLHPDLRLAPDAIRRFEREASLASGLGHPGIVAIHDFDVTDDGLHFLVMELLEGETLEQRLANEGPMPWRLALDRGKQIASALAAAHAVGVVHRDLKPANIFLARAPRGGQGGGERAVLLDFGLAKPVDAGTQSHLTAQGAAVGTPAYMSPEQARGQTLDARSDVWGFGAVLHEMLTGTPPFFDATVAGVYARLLTEPTPRLTLPGCPRDLAEIVERSLAKDPLERYADAAAMLAALDTCERNAGTWPPVAVA